MNTTPFCLSLSEIEAWINHLEKKTRDYRLMLKCPVCTRKKGTNHLENNLSITLALIAALQQYSRAYAGDV